MKIAYISTLVLSLLLMSGCSGGLARIHDSNTVLGIPLAEIHKKSEKEAKSYFTNKTFASISTIGFSRIAYINDSNSLYLWTVETGKIEVRDWSLAPNQDRLNLCTYVIYRGPYYPQCQDLSGFFRHFNEFRNGNVFNLKANSIASGVSTFGLTLDDLITLNPIR